MKKWAIFAALKVLELATLAGVVWGLYAFGHWIYPTQDFWYCVLFSICMLLFVTILLVAGAVIIRSAIPAIIHINIEWAEQIANRIGRRKN